MINISSHGVKFVLLEAQLLAGEIDRSAFLERLSVRLGGARRRLGG